MATYVRRFDFDPGDDVLLNIESVNILDLVPPGAIQGVGSGTVLLAGEFENGAFNQLIEITSPSSLQSTLGTLGYTYGTAVGNYPCAVKRSPDSAITPEAWNGNGFLALNGKQFARLFVCRVDTSVGSVTFTRLAWLTGAASTPSYVLAPGQILAFDLGAGQVSATFNATAATVTGAAGTYPTTFAGGETLTLGYDGAANFVTTFQSGDQSLAQVVARINGFAGFTFADTNGGQLRLTGIQKGTGAQVRVVAGSTGVLAKLGLTAANTAGTGNVANILAVSFTEVQTVVQGAIAGTKVELDSQGSLRVSNTATPATGTLTVGAATTATALGFVVGATSSAAAQTSGTIPAGTLVTNGAGSHVLLTMQDVAVTAASAGPYTVKVRYAVDDGTGAGETAGTITSVHNAPDLGAFSVNNASNLTAALTEAQIDAAYATALAAGGPTTDVNTSAKIINVLWCARHSNTVRRAVRTNVRYASAKGCFGRVGCISPPLNTTKAAAQGSGDPGVGATRDERVIYCAIGANVFVPLIAKVGTAGGFGFTASGNIDQTSDGWMASILSQLPPEENPGQDTPFTGAINGIETGANAQGLDMDDYIAFKAAGVAALRTDAGIAIFQSGVTSVDPLVSPSQVTIARRRMDDFIGDSIAQFAKGYGKKLMTRARRKAFKQSVLGFLKRLLSPNNPEAQRIAGYTVDDKSVNTDASLARGLYKLLVKVQTLPSMDSIGIIEEVGTTVEVAVSLPVAA